MDGSAQKKSPPGHHNPEGKTHRTLKGNSESPAYQRPKPPSTVALLERPGERDIRALYWPGRESPFELREFRTEGGQRVRTLKGVRMTRDELAQCLVSLLGEDPALMRAMLDAASAMGARP